MVNQQQVEALKQGATVWNAWRREHSEVHIGFNHNLMGADLSNADLMGANLIGADLSNADLMGADLSHANLSGANLIAANLSGANLSGASLNSADLIGADLSAIDLHAAEIAVAGIRKLMDSRSTAGSLVLELMGADLNAAGMRSLMGWRSTVDSRLIRRTIPEGSHCMGANLTDANLTDANLTGANLSGANLSGASLNSADLSTARLYHTIFMNVDLRLLKGLVQINHEGPSFVQLQTVQLPQDGSTFHFLRGVGVLDEWIDFYRTTMMHPIQYYSCFLSYSSVDDFFAKRLYADLQENGVRCWFAPHDLKPGNYMRKKIDRAIQMQDKLLLILSESAVNSGWVGYEVELALAREIRQKREILFPIRLDNEVLQSTSHWATTLQATRHIGDFTNWTDPQTYQQIFDRLLQDLKKADG